MNKKTLDEIDNTIKENGIIKLELKKIKFKSNKIIYKYIQQNFNINRRGPSMPVKAPTDEIKNKLVDLFTKSITFNKLYIDITLDNYIRITSVSIKTHQTLSSKVFIKIIIDYMLTPRNSYLTIVDRHLAPQVRRLDFIPEDIKMLIMLYLRNKDIESFGSMEENNNLHKDINILRFILGNFYPKIYDTVIRLEKHDEKDYSSDYLELLKSIRGNRDSMDNVGKPFDFSSDFVSRLRLFHGDVLKYDEIKKRNKSVADELFQLGYPY